MQVSARLRVPSLLKSSLIIGIVLLLMSASFCKDKLFGARQKYVDEFAKPNSHHSEIIFAKKYFSTAASKISKASYGEIVLSHMLGDAHGHPLRGELREAAETQMTELIARYLEKKNNKDSYTLDDLYFDVIGRRFQTWIDTTHPDVDRKLEPLEPEERARTEAADTGDL